MSEKDPRAIPESLTERLLRQPLLLAALGLVAVLVVAGTVWFTASLLSDKPVRDAILDLPSVDDTSVFVPSADGTASSEPTAPAADPVEGAETPDHGTQVVGNSVTLPLVAFREEGAVWVVAEDGAGPRRIVDQAAAFSLSPDGRTLVYVDPAQDGEIVFISVEDGSIARTGVGTSFANTRFDWRPGARSVICSLDDATIAEVAPSGLVRRLQVAPQRRVVGVSPDGAVLAYLGPDEHTLVVELEDGSTNELAVDNLRALAVGHDSLFLSCADPPRIERTDFDGGNRRTIIGKPRTVEGAVWGEMAVSPDGKKLAFSELFNDGYSRLYSATVNGKSLRSHWVRRDTYFLEWGSSSETLFFIEGNAWQGETTRLVRVQVDGTGRTVIAEGAGL